jgi:hypothetical protein
MSWRDFIPQDRLDEFDDDTLPVVKDKLQAGLYSGRHKDHAEDYVAGVEGDFEIRAAREASIIKRVGFVVAVGLVIVAVVETCSGQ